MYGSRNLWEMLLSYNILVAALTTVKCEVKSEGKKLNYELQSAFCKWTFCALSLFLTLQIESINCLHKF